MILRHHQLERVIDMLSKDLSLQNELLRVDHRCTTPLSAGAGRKLMKGIGERLPRQSGVKALEGVMDIDRKRLVMDGPDEFSTSQGKGEYD